MSRRQIFIGFLIFATLVIPLVQLSFGFHYIDMTGSCPIIHDIMLLMSIGGVFEIIFFAAAFGLVCAIIPSKYKNKSKKQKPTTQPKAQESNRASMIIVGFITGILGACAIIFFVLIQIRVYGSIKNVDTSNSTSTNYCLFTIYSSAFGLMISTYVAFILLITVSVILLCGICAPKM